MRALATAAPASSVTRPATAADVTPCVVTARTGTSTATAASTLTDQTSRFIRGISRALKKGSLGRGQKCAPLGAPSIRENRHIRVTARACGVTFGPLSPGPPLPSFAQVLTPWPPLPAGEGERRPSSAVPPAAALQGARA